MIKIAQGTYRMANKEGILPYYLSWCKMKGFNAQGRISRSEEGVADLGSFLGISSSTARKHLCKLTKFGFITRAKDAYYLGSYDTVWASLGLDLTKNKHKNRKGDFAIFKLQSVENLQASIEFCEIKHQINREAFKTKASILKDKCQFTDTELNGLKDCDMENLVEYLDNLYISRLSICDNMDTHLDDIYGNAYRRASGGNTQSFIKLTPYVSCYRTAAILGYTRSSKQGVLIRRRIEKAGLAKFEKRELGILNTKAWKDAIRAQRLMNKSTRFKEESGELSHIIISKMIEI